MKKYLVISKEENEIEFIILKKKNKISLLSSDSTVWNEWFRNTKLISLIDSGNDIKIKWYEKINKNKLDYSQEQYLRIILNFHDKQLNLPSKYKFLKSK
jgi:hypothetical protein